jgi:hypothetical protein
MLLLLTNFFVVNIKYYLNYIRFYEERAENMNQGLVLMAFLRTIYFSLKRNVIDPKEKVAKQVNEKIIFFVKFFKLSLRHMISELTKKLMKVGWLRYNLAYKYLKSMKSIYSLPFELSDCPKNIMSIYQIIFKAIRSILEDIKSLYLEYEDENIFTIEMVLLINEISKCLKKLFEQLNYVVWDKENINAADSNLINKHESRLEITREDECRDFVLKELFDLKNIKFIIKLLSIYDDSDKFKYE